MKKKYYNLFTAFSILLVLLIVFSISCDNNTDNVSPSITSNPEIVLNPNNNTPLSALLMLKTDEPTRVSVQVDSTGNNVAKTTITGNDSSYLIEFDKFNTSHSLPILGLNPGSSHSIEVTVFDEAGNETRSEEILQVDTGPLPERFPPIKVTSIPSMMEPGITLLHAGGRGGNGGIRYIIAVDELGQVKWFYTPNGGISDIRRLNNGNLIYIQNRKRLIEIDMVGNIINQWYAALTTDPDESNIPLTANSLHHEVFEMENGNFLVLSVELREVDNYPSSSTDPEAPLETAIVAGDVVIEFTRDGEIVNSYSMLDLLDPLRIGYASTGNFWDSLFPAVMEGTRDWSHGNAVVHDPSDDSIIVSLRHQDAVVKYSRATGELIWILGPHENWNQFEFGQYLLDPIGENFRFQYHQHAPMVTSDGNILLFDNGNNRASPFDEKLPATENFSRAVEFSVNEETMLVQQIWEFGEFINEPLYSPFLSDADQMPQTGNVLITFGGITKNESGEPTNAIAGSKISVKIFEVTHTDNPQIVFELSIVDESENIEDGWVSYRSERLLGLYP